MSPEHFGERIVRSRKAPSGVLPTSLVVVVEKSVHRAQNMVLGMTHAEAPPGELGLPLSVLAAL